MSLKGSSGIREICNISLKFDGLNFLEMRIINIKQVVKIS